MKLPDYNPDPKHIRKLLERGGLTQRGAARLLMVSPRTMRYWCSEDASRGEIPYPVQLALEFIAYLKKDKGK